MVESDWGENLVLMDSAILSKSLIQFSVLGEAVLPPCYFPGANYGGGDEDNVSLLQNVPCGHCYTQCPQPCNRPPSTHASTGDSWTLTGKSGSVSCGITSLFFWVLVHTRFCLCPPSICFPSPLSSGDSIVGLKKNFSKRAYAIPRSATQSPCPWDSTLWTIPLQKTLKHNFVSISVWSLDPGVHNAWVLWASLGFDSKCNFAPPTILLKLGASPLPLDVVYLLKITPAPLSCHSSTYHVARASLPLDIVYLLTATPEPVVCGYKDTNYEKSLLQRWCLHESQYTTWCKVFSTNAYTCSYSRRCIQL